LRAEVKHMEAAQQTPSEFGLKVRTHPDTLEITARNKMRSGRVLTWQTSYAGTHVEGYALHVDDDINKENRTAISNLVRDLPREKTSDCFTRNYPFWQSVPVPQIRHFLNEFKLHPYHKDFVRVLGARSLVEEYISKLVGNGELLHWDVVIPMIENGSVLDSGLIDGIDVRCRTRSGKYARNKDLWMINGAKQRVADRLDAKLGLTQDEISEAELTGRTDAAYNEVRSRPLLIIHDLYMNLLREVAQPVTFSICFPKTGLKHPEIEYTANKVLQNQLELEDEDLEFDDDVEAELA